MSPSSPHVTHPSCPLSSSMPTASSTTYEITQTPLSLNYSLTSAVLVSESVMKVHPILPLPAPTIAQQSQTPMFSRRTSRRNCPSVGSVRLPHLSSTTHPRSASY